MYNSVFIWNADVKSMDSSLDYHAPAAYNAQFSNPKQLCSKALHVRSLRLYAEFHREAHANSTPAELKEIISKCRETAKSSSKNVTGAVCRALRRKGTAHLLLTEPKRALATADQIIHLRFDWPYGYLLKADALLGAGEFAAAAHFYQLTLQLMPQKQPTDDFGRTEIDDQWHYLHCTMADLSKVTITNAHRIEITATASWPLTCNDPGAIHQTAAPLQDSSSARALQASVHNAVNDALEAMSHGSEYVHLPETRTTTALSPGASPNIRANGDSQSLSHSEHTLDHILAGEMRRKLPVHTPSLQPRSLQENPSTAECMSTVESSGTTGTEGPVLRSSAFDIDSKLPHSAHAPSLRAYDQDTLTGCIDNPAVNGTPTQCSGASIATSSAVSVGSSRNTSCLSDTMKCNQQGKGHCNLASEGNSLGVWSSLTRTETQQFLATGDLQGIIRVWDVTRLEFYTEINAHTSNACITSLAFGEKLRNGCLLYLASADAEGVVIVSAIDLSRNVAVSRQLENVHENRITSMRFIKGSRELITSSLDRSVRLWSVSSGRIKACLDGHKMPVTGMDCIMFKNAIAVATFSTYGTWYLWDLKLGRHFSTGKRAGRASLIKFSHTVMKFSRPRPLLITAHWAPKAASVYVWDVFDPNVTGGNAGSLEPWHSFTGIARGKVTDIAFTTDRHNKTLMAVSALDGSLIIYDLFSRSVLSHILECHGSTDCASDLKGSPHPVNAILYSHDGRLLITCGGDCTIKVWSTSDMEVVLTLFGHISPITSVNKISGSDMIATVSECGQLAFWDLKLAQDLASNAGVRQFT